MGSICRVIARVRPPFKAEQSYSVACLSDNTLQVVSQVGCTTPSCFSRCDTTLQYAVLCIMKPGPKLWYARLPFSTLQLHFSE